MKRTVSLAAAAALGAAGFLLRRWQLSAAFEPLTGLPVPHLSAWLLPLLLAAAALVFLLPALRTTAGRRTLNQDFTAAAPGLPLLLAGALLTAVCGGWLVMTSLGGSLLELLIGALAAVTGLALLWSVFLWKRGQPCALPLLLAPIFQTCWLLYTYADVAANPVMSAVYPVILAQCAFTVSFYEISAHAYSFGGRRTTAAVLPWSVVMGLAALGETMPLFSRGLFLSSLLTIAGFMLCRREKEERRDPPTADA